MSSAPTKIGGAKNRLVGGSHSSAPIVCNGMDAPTRNGINVPKWKCLATT